MVYAKNLIFFWEWGISVSARQILLAAPVETLSF
jgi:hypothetical protein